MSGAWPSWRPTSRCSDSGLGPSTSTSSRLPISAAVLLAVDPLLDGHDLAPAPLDDLLRHLVRRSRRRRCPPRPSTGSSPAARSAASADELLEQLEVLLGLARQPDDERGAEGEPRDARAQLGRAARSRNARVPAAPHRAQQPVRGVLQRHVQVLGDLRLARHHLDQLVGEDARVGVVQADPAHVHLCTAPGAAGAAAGARAGRARRR